VVRFLFRQGMRRGVLGGNRIWMYVFAGAGLLRIFTKLAGNDEKVVFSEELKPGQALIISNPSPKS
jgi:hypothetical protein